MAPAYKLTYFDARGVAETIRFLFHYGGIEFEDIRVVHDEKAPNAWAKIKASAPFGQVPFLEHNGKKVNQSLAIARYVAKQVGLVGNNDWESLEIDAIVDTFTDLRMKMYPVKLEHDPEKRKANLNTFKESVKYTYTRFEELTKKNNGYLAAGKLSWADVHFAALSPAIDDLCQGDVLVSYPGLQALRNKVNEIAAIKKWIAVRPKTAM